MEQELATQNQPNSNKKESTFDKYIKPVLQYVGTIGATLMCIAYIVCVVILIEGFETHELKGDLLFASVNAGVGLIIMQFLKVQGISFAKNIPENTVIINEYYNSKTKDKKPHSIKWYWLWSFIKDICLKGIGIALTTFGIMYIVVEGCKDYTLFLLAAVNLIMFICFGLLALNNAYEFYNNKHIPFLKDKIKEIKENKDGKQQLSRCEHESVGHAKPSRVQQKKKRSTRQPNSSSKGRRKQST